MEPFVNMRFEHFLDQRLLKATVVVLLLPPVLPVLLFHDIQLLLLGFEFRFRVKNELTDGLTVRPRLDDASQLTVDAVGLFETSNTRHCVQVVVLIRITLYRLYVNL